jgi:FMN phosphatase YigB (HAD superfamily)
LTPLWPKRSSQRWRRPKIDALSCARRAQQQAYKAIRSSAEQQLERRRYEAALAERQFNRVDPDNRLVAAELERRWEAALKEVQAAEEALARLKSPEAIAQITVGNKALNDKVVRLSSRLPEIWTTRARPTRNAKGCCAVSLTR